MAFVVEGPLLIGEAVAAGWDVHGQFLAPGADPVDGAGTAHRLAEGVLERVTATEAPRGVMAEVAMVARPTDLRAASFVLVGDGLADPGNAGTILRSAEAAGVGVVVLTAGSVDPFNPKVVRASAGAIFRVPVIIDGSWTEVLGAGFRVVGSSAHTGTPYTRCDLTGRLALAVGSEARGLAPDAPVAEWVTIPHAGRAESLNVAMAATVLCFEAARQRATA